MSYIHYIVAHIDTVGRTTYFHVAGSWHDHPGEATEFFTPGFAEVTARFISHQVKGGRLEVMKVTSVVEPLPMPLSDTQLVKEARKVLAETGNVIEAVKYIRLTRGWGLREAKEFYEGYVRENNLRTTP